MATYYIDPAGDDGTGDGSEGNPWATISHAYTNSSSGDTIHCLAGTYTWVSQTFSTARIVQGAGATTTIFDAGGIGSTVQWRAVATGTEYNDLTFRENGQTSRTLAMFAGGINGGDPVYEMNRCIFHTLDYSGTTGAIDDEQALFGGTKGVGNGRTASWNFNSCCFYNITSSSSTGFIFSMVTWGNRVNTMTFKNCSLYLPSGSGFAGVLYTYTPTGATLTAEATNCILASDDSTVSYGTSYWDTLSYCCIYNFSTNPSIETVITTDPLFIDPTNGDLRLRPTSPCIDSGTLI